MTGASEVFDLAADFGKAPAGVVSGLYDAFAETGDSFAEDWADNARGTAGAHAAQHPGFIDSETLLSFGIHVTTGPRAEGQGMLGRILELGSATSPPHLDGLRAMPAAEKSLERAAETRIERVLP